MDNEQNNTLDNSDPSETKCFKDPFLFNYGDYKKTIYDFSRNLDYSLKTSSERVEYLNSLLYNNGELEEYFVDLFAQVPTGNLVESPASPPFKVCLTKNDKLCSDSYASHELEKMADYILRADDNAISSQTQCETDALGNYYKHNASIDTILSKDQYSEIEEDLIERAKHVNFIKKSEIKIESKDFTDKTFNVPVTHYKTMPDGTVSKTSICENILAGYEELKKAKFTCSEGKRRRIVSEIAADQIETKKMLKRYVRYKNAGPYSTKFDWFLVDYSNPEHVKNALLLVGDMTTDQGIIEYDMDFLVDKADFGETDSSMLADYRNGCFDAAKWANTLGMTVNGVYKRIDRITNKIVAVYKDIYEDWYYLNCEKGQYKLCKKCGKVLLVSKFGVDKHKPDGLCSHCKKCRSAQKS